jgi:heme exporter protein CcmD
MGYVWAGYSITLVSLAAYAVWILRRARSLDRRGRR